jgi:hypothetical protein
MLEKNESLTKLLPLLEETERKGKQNEVKLENTD